MTNQGPPRTPEDKRSYEGARSKTREHKLSALKSYRRGKGLRYKCGEKWSPQHKCPAQVSLNAIEEIWKWVSDGEETISPSTEEGSDSGEDLMAISSQAYQW